MKKNILFLFLLVPITNHVFATIWRVNNNPGIVANFTTAQAAHDDASPGDTLHFEPSVNSYGFLSLSKRLVLISLGSFLPENTGLQYTSITASLTGINMNAGAANSVLMVNTTGNINISNTNNVTLLRCRTVNISLVGADNILLLNSFIEGSIFSNSGSTGNIFSNNIIRAVFNIQLGSAATVTNNVIGQTANASCTFNNCVIQNNIFVNPALDILGASNVFQNNLSAGNQLPGGNTNAVNMNNVFVNSAGLVDNAFVLQTAVANPAQGAGVGGIDCGAFGGGTPFVLGLIPPIPSIFKLQAPVTPVGNSMQVIISTRSNN